MSENEILDYFRNFGIDLTNRPDYQTDKKAILAAAEETVRFIEEYAGEELKVTGTVDKMFEHNLNNEINN